MKKQMEMFGKETRRLVHGGAPSSGKRKLERPLSRKKPIHLVLRSTRAKGAWSFRGFKNQSMVKEIISEKARKFGITIGEYANVGNHLHLKIRIQSREMFQKFLRAVTTLIARKITGACRGNPQGKFWDELAFTRVLKTWTEELFLNGYIHANRIEGDHGKELREKYLKLFRDWMAGRSPSAPV